MSEHSLKPGDVVRLKSNPNQGEPTWTVGEISPKGVAVIYRDSADGNLLRQNVPVVILVKCDPAAEQRETDVRNDAAIQEHRNRDHGF